MDEPSPETAAWPYMLSGHDAVRFLGLTPAEFQHFVWLKQIHPYPGGVHEYYRRAVLERVMDELFAESQEMGARLLRLSHELFWKKYDEKFGPGDRREQAIRGKIEKELRNYDIEDVARSMNFGNCMNLLGNLSDLEKARVVDVLLELDVLTDLGKAYHACVKSSLESD